MPDWFPGIAGALSLSLCPSVALSNSSACYDLLYRSVCAPRAVASVGMITRKNAHRVMTSLRSLQVEAHCQDNERRRMSRCGLGCVVGVVLASLTAGLGLLTYFMLAVFGVRKYRLYRLVGEGDEHLFSKAGEN